MNWHKFRVWNKDTNEYLNTNDMVCINMSSEGVLCALDTFGCPIYDELLVELCTGLKDKNGKLIYEGDIVLLSGTQYNIIWNPIHCQYIATIGQSWYIRDSHEITSDMEIIGNVHDKTLEQCIAEASPALNKINVDTVMKELRGENTSVCPQCGVEQEDFDGFGMLYCPACGYCKHASRTEGKCDSCGSVDEAMKEFRGEK